MDAAIASFHWMAKQNGKKSAAEGRPVFEQVPYVHILIPGNDKSIVDRKVTDEDKERWPEKWEAFLKNAEQTEEGTLLEQWPAINVAEVATLKALNVKTVDALASLSDLAVQKYGPGGMKLREKAQAFLKAAGNDGVVYEAMEQVESLKKRVEELEQRNKEQIAYIERLERAKDKRTLPKEGE